MRVLLRRLYMYSRKHFVSLYVKLFHRGGKGGSLGEGGESIVMSSKRCGGTYIPEGTLSDVTKFSLSEITFSDSQCAHQ
jgi:hypothetical protein